MLEATKRLDQSVVKSLAHVHGVGFIGSNVMRIFPAKTAAQRNEYVLLIAVVAGMKFALFRQPSSQSFSPTPGPAR